MESMSFMSIYSAEKDFQVLCFAHKYGDIIVANGEWSFETWSLSLPIWV